MVPKSACEVPQAGAPGSAEGRRGAGEGRGQERQADVTSAVAAPALRARAATRAPRASSPVATRPETYNLVR